MNNQNHIPDSLLEKIQKLMRVKDDGSASQGEIENATKMINTLLMKHNLEMSQVIGHGMDKNQMTDDSFDLNGKQTRHEAGWVVQLFNVIANHNLCECLHELRSNRNKDDMGSMIVIGTKVNIEIVYYTVDQLHERIKEMCGRAWKEYVGQEKRNTYRRGYLRGAVVGINNALRAQSEQRMKQLEIPTLENQQMGLMLRSNAQALTAYMQEEYGHGIKRSKSTGLSGRGGFEQGKHDGSNMGINKGLSKGSTAGYLN